MKSYRTHLQVLSHHCDSSGIVHYPRYGEMALEVVERWFDEALDWSFARMQGGDGLAVPVGRASTEFPAASRLGDHLVWRLTVRDIGRSSMDLVLDATCGGESRAHMSLTLVLSETGIIRTRHWPDVIRARAEEYIPAAAAQ